MIRIESVQGIEILDSRGNPTLEVEVVVTGGHRGRAAVPSGASTGAHEACELRDGDAKRFLGKGVLRALANLHEVLAPKLKGMSVESQESLDRAMMEWDGTPNKSKLGANAILGVSLAAAQARAAAEGRPLFQSLGGPDACRLPVPLMNVLNGGAHANNGLDVQEFMIVPLLGSFKDSLRAGAEVFQTLKKILGQKGLSTAVGDEGGFAPRLESNQVALDLLMQAIEKAGYKPGQEILLALDVAATELYSDGQYLWEGKKISPEELLGVYKSWAQKYPLRSIEDGFSEDDWSSWQALTKELGGKVQIVGDDLFVTNPKRLKEGIAKSAANALLVKVNQIGTLTETMEAVKLAHQSKFNCVMSHRSGETEDTFIADLAVGLGCAEIKTGSLCRGERTAKYNQLLRIERTLGSRGVYRSPWT